MVRRYAVYLRRASPSRSDRPRRRRDDRRRRLARASGLDVAPAPFTNAPIPYPTAQEIAARAERTPTFGALRFVAQIRSMFLICEGEDGLYVLDQHAAAETASQLRSLGSAATKRAKRREPKALVSPSSSKSPPKKPPSSKKPMSPIACPRDKVRSAGAQLGVAVHP